MVIGSRAKKDARTQVDALWYRKVMGRLFHALMGFFVRLRDYQGQPIQDSQCGFKWFTRKAAEKIFSRAQIDGFAFDVEILFLANRLRVAILEMPVNWQEKGDSRVNFLIDPLKMLWEVMTISFLHRKTRGE
jgi:dolichyl-phosphate beta-glucosyltransferase